VILAFLFIDMAFDALSDSQWFFAQSGYDVAVPASSHGTLSK
jgi:hypothetical protein